MPDHVDAADLLDRLEGIPSPRAAELCGVHSSTIRRWRRNGVVTARMAAAAYAALDRAAASDLDPRQRCTTTPDDRQHSHPLDVHCTWTDRGWILDAYHHGTIEPLNAQALAVAEGQRWPTLEAAQAHARERWGDRIVTMTVEADR